MTALREYRERAGARLAALDEELAAIRIARSDALSDDEHDPEGSTLSSDWSRIAGLRADALAQFQQAETALARAANGRYGICASCGRLIAPGRLIARPSATECVSCAA
ncbi:TraR/DksA C4-type zinc finger protein [soil metagenome]